MKENNFANFNENTLFYIYKTNHNYDRNSKLYDSVMRLVKVTDDKTNAEAVIVIGGDGSLLDVVRDKSLKGLPVLPINGGTVGKNLIDISIDEIDEFILDFLLKGKCIILKFPKLSAKVIDEDGKSFSFSAFNDIWVDRQDSLSVRYDLAIEDSSFENEIQCISDSIISGDGVLFATPMGSTGYSSALSETVLPLHKDTMMINPMSSKVLNTKRKVHSFAASKEQIIHVTFKDIDFRKTRIAVEGVYVTNDNKYINVRDLKISLNSNNKDYLEIIARSKEDFIRKQMDFIAR